jgi:hypothetical protein
MESESESESVGYSDKEVTFSLYRFPSVNVKPLLRSRSYPVTSHYQQQEEVERQRQQHEDEHTENDDYDDFFQQQYNWDDDGDQYFDDCGLDFVSPENAIDNIDLTSESAEEALFIATYKYGKTLNCVNVERKSSRHMKRMKKLGATPMFSGSNFTIAHYFILLFEHRVRYNSGDNEIHNMVY